MFFFYLMKLVNYLLVLIYLQQPYYEKYKVNFSFPTHFYSKSVPGAPCCIDPDNDNHEAYLGEFKSMLMAKMRNSIDKDLVNDPDVIKGRKKTVQVMASNIFILFFNCKDFHLFVPLTM